MSHAATLYQKPATASLRDYFFMTRPTVTLLVVITAIPGLFPLHGNAASFSVFMATLIGTALASASASVCNQLIERRSDQLMDRTMGRALPSGKMSLPVGIAYGGSLMALSFILLWFGAHPLSAWVALASHVFYIVVYTLILKPRSVQNIVIGGASGCVGPLIASAAVHGTLDLESWLLFTLIFLWTPPHFWALALKYKEDYKKAGIPMYPVVKGDEATRSAILLYSLPLIGVVLWLYFIGSFGVAAFSVSMLLTLKLCFDAWKLKRSKSLVDAMRFFHFSCIYTFAIFAAMAVERIW